MVNDFKTPQESFWAGEFGEDYIERNDGDQLLAANLNFFNNALKMAIKPTSMVEFGANIGMNLKAMKLLFPEIQIKAIEINKKAHAQLSQVIGSANAINCSIFRFLFIDSPHLELKLYPAIVITGTPIHIASNDVVTPL